MTAHDLLLGDLLVADPIVLARSKQKTKTQGEHQ